MNKKPWIILLIIVLFGTACSTAVRSASSVPNGTPLPVSTEVAASDVTEAESFVATDRVIVFQQEGGFAGITKQWIILPDGTIEAPGEIELTAEPDDLAALITLTNEEEISGFKSSYIPKDHCCDQFLYTVTIKDGSEEKTIRTSDDVQQPQQLTELIDTIQQLIANAQ